jgi:hypothetical protein
VKQTLDFEWIVEGEMRPIPTLAFEYRLWPDLKGFLILISALKYRVPSHEGYLVRSEAMLKESA